MGVLNRGPLYKSLSNEIYTSPIGFRYAKIENTHATNLIRVEWSFDVSGISTAFTKEVAGNTTFELPFVGASYANSITIDCQTASASSADVLLVY